MVHRAVGLVCNVELEWRQGEHRVVIAANSLVLNNVEIHLIRLSRQVYSDGSVNESMSEDCEGPVTELGSKAIVHVVYKRREANRESDWGDQVGRRDRACCDSCESRAWESIDDSRQFEVSSHSVAGCP